jgi:aspartyl protease family protein
MGFVKTKVRISNPANDLKRTEIELLVDTGATFTLIPGTVLREIGAETDTRFRLKMADGKFIEREGATIYAEVEGKGYKVPVIVGQEDDVPVLGVTTLEILGLEVDPIAEKLRPTDYLLL